MLLIVPTGACEPWEIIWSACRSRSKYRSRLAPTTVASACASSSLEVSAVIFAMPATAPVPANFARTSEIATFAATAAPIAALPPAAKPDAELRVCPRW